MINRLSGNKVVGVKQTVKSIKNGKAKTVYVANDADQKFIQPVIQLAQENSIEIININSMKELGKLCGIDVGAATCAVLLE
jgi:large subunit ribosomal protein L7A